MSSSTDPAALPDTRFSTTVDSVVVRLGKAASWLWIVIIVVIVITIVIRYGATKLGVQAESYWGSRLISSVFWEELSWYIYGYAWLLALGYAMVSDVHVRVDLIHERISRRNQVWIEILGLLFFFLPTFIAIACHGLDFGLTSFRDSEGSQQVGLDFLWIPKFSISIASLLLVVTGLSKLTRCFKWIRQQSVRGTMPLLVCVQVLGVSYLGSVFYLMFNWSLDNQEMTVFKVFGLY